MEKVSNGASVQYRGFTIDLLEKLSDLAGFSYEIYEVPDGAYGRIGPTGTWNGLVGELINGVL